MDPDSLTTPTTDHLSSDDEFFDCDDEDDIGLQMNSLDDLETGNVRSVVTRTSPISTTV